jgi:hypothetical protein
MENKKSNYGCHPSPSQLRLLFPKVNSQQQGTRGPGDARKEVKKKRRSQHTYTGIIINDCAPFPPQPLKKKPRRRGKKEKK